MIGDTSNEFDLTAGFTVCQDVFGGLQVAGNNASGMRTSTCGSRRTTARPTPTARVDTFAKEGDAASGSATFVDDSALDDVEPVQGSFEVACEN